MKPEISNPTLTELALSIANGDLTSADALESVLGCAKAAQSETNAVAVWRDEEARREAAAADASVREGKWMGHLHGVPMSIKECFDLAGTPSTMGLPSRAHQNATEDGEIVRRLRRAGAIIFAKTNVPQLMISHETCNPLYGRTNNPWDAERTPGGSSGGEAALIASGGSPGGLGSDLGGSIRVPCHFCGITGLKPTSGRLPRHGGIGSMRGLDAVIFQPGPMAQNVTDCARILDAICDSADSAPSPQAPPLPLGDWAKIDVKGMRIGYFVEDGIFPPSPSIKRAVLESMGHLRNRGAEILEFAPLENQRAFELFLAALSADGAADHFQFVKGNPRERAVSRLIRLMALPMWFRRVMAFGVATSGDQWLSKILVSGGEMSVAKYWQLTREIQILARQCMSRFRQLQLSALVFPVYALPAVKHGDAIDALPAASYSIFTNVLGTPCGAVPVTKVQNDEEGARPKTRDSALRAATRAETGSTGLPIGVQVMADYWREDIALAVMKAIEDGAGFQDRPPPRWVVK